MVVTFTTCMGIIATGVYLRLKSESRLHILRPSVLFPFLFTKSKTNTNTLDGKRQRGDEGKFSMFASFDDASSTASSPASAWPASASLKKPYSPPKTMSRSKSTESSKSLHPSNSQATLIDLPKLEEGFLSDFSEFINTAGERNSTNAAATTPTSSTNASASTGGGFRLFQRRNSKVQPASKGFSFFSRKK